MRQSSIQNCVYCQSQRLHKKGFYYVRSLRLYRRRFQCLSCQWSFSTQTQSSTFRQKRPDLNVAIRELLLSGLPQRGIARLLRCNKNTVDNKIQWLFLNSKASATPRKSPKAIFIDEMETIEHTKLKPLTIPLAVSDDYKLLSIKVGKIPAKGHLSRLSIRKYGQRKNERISAVKRLFENLKTTLISDPEFIHSDEAPIYRALVKRYFPNSIHKTHSSRAQITAKKEMVFLNQNKKVFDPLFPINQKCAKLRADIRRLTRRSWCTTKKPENLAKILELYQLQNA